MIACHLRMPATYATCACLPLRHLRMPATCACMQHKLRKHLEVFFMFSSPLKFFTAYSLVHFYCTYTTCYNYYITTKETY
jgi:hypothetical protein